MGARGLPVGPELRAAALRRLSSLAESLCDLADDLDVLVMALTEGPSPIEGVSDSDYAEYVNREVRELLADALP